MLAFLVVCVVLAISATYELIEWAVAVWLGQGADDFLGTQGDPWDTQSDMFFALIGAVTALVAVFTPSGSATPAALAGGRRQDGRLTASVYHLACPMMKTCCHVFMPT